MYYWYFLAVAKFEHLRPRGNIMGFRVLRVGLRNGSLSMLMKKNKVCCACDPIY